MKIAACLLCLLCAVPSFASGPGDEPVIKQWRGGSITITFGDATKGAVIPYPGGVLTF